jgi:hypothetical protein
MISIWELERTLGHILLCVSLNFIRKRNGGAGGIVGVLHGRTVSPLGGYPSTAGGMAPGPGFDTYVINILAKGNSMSVGRLNFPLHINS